MITDPQDPALHSCLLAYSASIYPHFESIGEACSREAANFCSQWVQETPLCRDPSGSFPERDIPHLGKRSVIYAVAVMTAFLVWMQKNQNLPQSPLLKAASEGYILYKALKQ
jgi:hypothetical protein